ncbi:MAG: SDR family oxidoreductase [Marinicaulis sp.]|nr:SDR family oxidoreductase [Marinicaulis sp.]
MAQTDNQELASKILPDLLGKRMLVIGAGGIGKAAALMAYSLGVEIAVANRSQPKLDQLRKTLPEISTHLINAREQTSINRVLGDVKPDHIVLATGRVQGFASGSIDLAEAMDYFGDRFEPIMAIANWIASNAKKSCSFTIVSGFIGVPTMGNLAWSAVGPAIKGLVEHLAVELGPTRVNAVAPGPVVDTQMARDVVGTDEGVSAMAAALSKQLPIGRAVVVEDVARQIMMVAGDPTATGSIRFTEGGISLVPSSVIADLHMEKEGDEKN